VARAFVALPVARNNETRGLPQALRLFAVRFKRGFGLFRQDPGARPASADQRMSAPVLPA